MAEKISTTQHAAYERIRSTEEFATLRKRYLGFAFPMTVAFMAWYLLYVICSNWAGDLLDTRVIGNINLALVFGLLQFVSTFAIAWLYARHADRKLDAAATRLREQYDTEIDR